jgi:hypothetical protein
LKRSAAAANARQRNRCRRASDIYCYSDPELASEIVVVKFDGANHAVAFPLKDLRRVRR